MSENEHKEYVVAVIGAGAAGIYAARQLSSSGVHVALLNRDIKPGGLAEYGIYYDKYKMKEGLRKQFRQILAAPAITYYGNVIVGKEGDLTLEDLRGMGFQGAIVAVGAQGTKWLGLPGENFKRVYHAKDLVYHYNKLPPFSTQKFSVCGRVALVGVGNVMMDIAHWLIRDLKVEEVIAVARRGPAEVKFTRKEMEAIGGNLDQAALDAEIERCTPVMQVVGQDVQAARDYILAGTARALSPVSGTRFRFEFLASPARILGDDQGNVCGLEIEDTTLTLKDGDTRARSLGSKRLLNVDTVVFCIGDRVDENFGLPVQRNEFVKNPSPRFPVDGHSYEVFDPQTNQPVEGIFVVGWSREASSGLVGVARKDGENGAEAMLQYLQGLPEISTAENAMALLDARLAKTGKPLVCKEDIARLDEFERAEAARLGVEEYKLKSNAEMLAVIGK